MSTEITRTPDNIDLLLHYIIRIFNPDKPAPTIHKILVTNARSTNKNTEETDLRYHYLFICLEITEENDEKLLLGRDSWVHIRKNIGKTTAEKGVKIRNKRLSFKLSHEPSDSIKANIIFTSCKTVNFSRKNLPLNQ